jgi:tetratricopeptide (TPR) repeat protein
MAKTGRNDPCPCGSRKKYKKCCLAKDEAAARERAKEAEVAGSAALDPVFVDDDDDHLAEDSNRVIDLIDAGRLDEAEAEAHELVREYPEVVDGLERLAMVHEKRGNNKLAAEYYRKAAAFLEHDRYAGPEWRPLMIEKADKLDPPE